MDPFPDGDPSTGMAARRATIDDLPALNALWQQCGLPAGDLERYVTEFQVVASADGALLMAIGLQVDGSQGLVHSEAVSAPEEDKDPLRALIWTRLQVVARNLGAVSLWTLEDAAFWRTAFRKASPAEVAGLQASFSDPDAEWWTHPLVDVARLEQMAQKQAVLRGDLNAGRGDPAFDETIRRVKVVAYSLAAVVILLLVAFSVYVLVHRDILQRALQSSPAP